MRVSSPVRLKRVAKSYLVAMKKRISGAKIACLDINLQKARMQLGVQILVEDANDLEDIRRRYIPNWFCLRSVTDNLMPQRV